MIYYMIKHKATGELMPELDRGRGYSHWNPSKVDTREQFGRKKLLGVPRLFASRQKAFRSIVQWNACPNSYMGLSNSGGYLAGDEFDIQIKPDGRSKEDLEIVEANLEIRQ